MPQSFVVRGNICFENYKKKRCFC